MKVVADIDGWKKVFNTNEIVMKSGILEVMLSKPLSFIVPENDIVMEDVSGIVIRFYRTDYYISNLPVFKYERG